METNLLIIISFVAWLVPTILDTVIQINNALVVNHLAQTHIDENGRIGDITIVMVKFINRHFIPISVGGLNYPPALCCLPQEEILETPTEKIETSTISFSTSAIGTTIAPSTPTTGRSLN